MMKMTAPAATPHATWSQNNTVPSLTSASHLRPLAEQVVVNASQLHDRRMRRDVARELLNGYVEIEQQRPAAVIANHALNPEERRDARTSGDGGHAVKAGR